MSNVKLNIISHYGNLNVILYVICLHSTAYECKQVEKTHTVVQTHTHTHRDKKSICNSHRITNTSSGFCNKRKQGGHRKETEIIHVKKKDIPQNGPAHTHTYFAVLWRVEDVHSAGFDAIGLGPSVQGEAALSAPAISAWKRAIVPGGR